MKQAGGIVPFCISIAFGAALWFLVSALTGKREAWDASVYWAAAYPAAIFVSGLLGHFYPERPWRWAILLFQAQALAMCIRSGELGNLLPIGIVLFAVLALPAVAAAKLASRRRRRLEEGAT